MYQIPQETIAYQIQLPQFVHNFKNNVVQMVVPHLLQVKKYLNDEENQQTLNPIITVFAVVFVALVIKNVLGGLFGKREEGVKGYEQAPELTGQINDLKKQLKSMKSAFNDLAKDFTQKKTNSTASNQQILTKSTSTSASQNNQLCTQLLQLYTGSLDNNKRMANYVVQSLFQILSQLKRFKKIQRASLSSGRPSTSTIKSSERRLQSAISSKSPFKTINSIKKPQIKNSQRSIRSQITEKLQKKTQEGFLMPVQETPKVQRAPNHEVLVTKSSIPKLSEPAVEKKLERVQNPVRNQQNQIPKVESVKPSRVPTQVPQVKLPKVQSQIQLPRQENKVQTTRHVVHQQTEISETLNGQISQKVTIQTTVSEVSQAVENMNGVTVIQTQQIQTQQTFEGQTNSQATQFIVPPKLPAIKKMVPPKPGVKRGPPPPPKKVV